MKFFRVGILTILALASKSIYDSFHTIKIFGTSELDIYQQELSTSITSKNLHDDGGHGLKKDEIDRQDNEVKRVTVIDNTLYDGEHVLLFRLVTLYDKVDRFYIVESNFTMYGQRKESLHKDRNEHLFEPFKDKIRWVVAGEEARMDEDRSYEDKRRDLRTVISSVVEDDLENGIISDPFVIINSEVDEIINPNDIDEFQLGRKYHELVTQLPVILEMESFEYNMNWKAKNKIANAEVLPGRMVSSTNLFHLPMGGGSSQVNAMSLRINSGYRLGNFFDPDGLSNKMNYTGAGRKGHMLDSLLADECAQKCTTGEEPCTWKRCNQDLEHWDYKQAPAALQKLHEAVCKIQNVDPSTGDLLSDSSPKAFSSVAGEIQVAATNDWTPISDDILYNGQHVTVIDATLYNGEAIALARLAALNDVVDRFYISEGTHTFSGVKKEKLYKDINSHLFEPFKDKIRWVVHDMSGVDKANNWGREFSGRKSLQPAIREDFERGEVSHPFVVVNTDVDEIPEPKDIADFQPGKKYHTTAITSMIVFEMNAFYYNLNWKATRPWTLAHTIPGHLALKGFEDFQFTRMDRHVNWAAAKIPRGYHMSFFMDAAGIRNKLESYSHQEKNIDQFKSDDYLLEKISTGNDLFGRAQVFHHWDYKQVPISLQNFHEEVCQKQGVDPVTGVALGHG